MVSCSWIFFCPPLQHFIHILLTELVLHSSMLYRTCNCYCWDRFALQFLFFRMHFCMHVFEVFLCVLANFPPTFFFIPVQNMCFPAHFWCVLPYCRSVPYRKMQHVLLLLAALELTALVWTMVTGIRGSTVHFLCRLKMYWTASGVTKSLMERLLLNEDLFHSAAF